MSLFFETPSNSRIGSIWTIGIEDKRSSGVRRLNMDDVVELMTGRWRIWRNKPLHCRVALGGAKNADRSLEKRRRHGAGLALGRIEMSKHVPPSVRRRLYWQRQCEKFIRSETTATVNIDDEATDSHDRWCEGKPFDGFNEVLAPTVPSAELMANSNVERHGPSKHVVEKRSLIVHFDVFLCIFLCRHSITIPHQFLRYTSYWGN